MAVVFLACMQPVASSAATILQTSLSHFDLDGSQFREWDGEIEKAPIGGHGPEWVVWTQQSTPGAAGGTPGNTGINYGSSKTPGWRHLRVGFHRTIAVGSVFVRGGGQLSVLKPDAAYPGNLADDSHWIPAERLNGDAVTRQAVPDHDYAVWVLPPGTTTRAMRFSHFSPSTDPIYVGYLAGAYVLTERVQNLAPQAVAVASSRPELARLVNDQHENHHYNGPSLWENGASGSPPQSGGSVAVSESDPEFVILDWPSEVTLSGIALSGQAIAGAGFARAKIQRFAGALSQRPREAAESSWETILEIASDPLSPQLNVAEFDWFAFPSEVTTRALRLLITQGADTSGSDPTAINEFVRGGKRVWLEEWMALTPMGTREVQTAIIPKHPIPRPPIPVTFTLEKPGVVTLVIEDAAGRRVRNLVSETSLPAGQNTVWWDGYDDQASFAYGPEKGLLFDPQGLSSLTGSYGRNHVRPKLVEPGTYAVRGLVRDPLDLAYEFSIYSPGDPPWPTFGLNGQPYRFFLNLERSLTPELAGVLDRSFGWLADHTPPSDALFLPGTGPQVLLSSYISEAGNGLAWVTLEGQKARGQPTIGGFWSPSGFVESGEWTGASCLARDDGSARVPGVVAYAASAFGQELRIHRIGSLGTLSRVIAYPLENPGERDLGGLAAHDGRLIASLRKLNQLLFVNAPDGAVLGTSALDDPRGLAVDAGGRLLAISGNRLLRFQSATGSINLSAPEELAAGLDDPQRLALDSSGNIYLSLHGGSHQVRVLSPNGVYLRTIGAAGTPRPGPYNPQQMQHPLGLTITPDNRLWVAENDYAPKRISVWTTDGAFVKAFYGGPQYGGGGVIDPLDRTRFYYYDRGGMEFRIHWESGTSELVNIYHRASPDDLRLPLEEHVWFRGPQTPIHFDGHHYMVSDNENPGGGSRAVSVWKVEGGRTYPAATISVIRTFADQPVPFWPILTNKPFASMLPEPPGLVAWSDLNGNHQVETDELQFKREAPGSLSINERLEISTSNFKVFKPVRFTPAGVPVYDLNAIQSLLVNPPDDPRFTAEQTIHRPDAWTIKAANSPLRGVRDGALRWTYPNGWSSLQATVSHPTPRRSHPGEVFGTMGILGLPVVPSSGDAGEVLGVYGYYGNIYLFTTDGLFLATLFQDERDAPAWMMPQLARGTSLNEISLHDEAFWPGMTKTSDGRIYLTVGKNHSSIVRVDGLESVRRITLPSLDVGTNWLAEAASHLDSLEHLRLQSHGRSRLGVGYRSTPPVVDGDLGEWADADWVRIDENAKAALRLAHGKLFAAFEVQGPEAIRNIGEPATALFATGGGLDLFLGTDEQSDPTRTEPVAGDLRLFVTIHHGAPKAFAYQPTAVDKTHSHEVKSSWRTTRFDRVQEVSASLELRQKGAGYEFSVPLEVLGWKPRAGAVHLGDLGVIRGRSGQAVHKAYWNNQAPNAHQDMASEARLKPHLWGWWRVAEDFPAGAAADNLAPSLPRIPDLQATEGIPLTLKLTDRYGLWHQLIPNVWGMPGTPQNIAYLTHHPSFTEFNGGSTVLTQGFNVPGTAGPITRHNHAQRVWGWIEPPLDGEYIFWISSGGLGAEGISEGILFLSTNEAPAAKRPIASNTASPPGNWTASPSQRSAPVSLAAGRRYYIEALHNEQIGPAHLSVGWTLPNGRVERPLPPHHLHLDPAPIDRIDLDWPPQTLSYSVETEPGAAIVIQSSSGTLSWRPEESSGGQTVGVTVHVTDSGSPPRSTSTSFRIAVAEVNSPPQLTRIPDVTIGEGQTVTFPVTIADPDLPAQVLNSSLAPGAPTGAAITPQGTFSWTPSETHGSGTYPVTVRVTDDGSPPLSAEQTFTVTVNEVNSAPVLAPITTQTAGEGTPFTLTPSALDADLPVSKLAWSLGATAPAGMTIDAATGRVSWTPDETQGGATFQVAVTVTDDGVPPLSATQAFSVSVAEANRAPELAAVSDQTVDELSELTFTATATDTDLPAQKLTFTLAPPVPANAAIDPATGVFRFTPSEDQGPDVHTFTIRVNDDAADRLVDRKSFMVTVKEVNTAPKLHAAADLKLLKGGSISFTATAADSDLPTQALSFTLESDAPPGASIEATSGLFSWTPAAAGTNIIAIKVTDNGTPPLSDTTSFTVAVTAEVKPPRIVAFGLTVDGRFQLSWESEPGARYQIESKLSLQIKEWAPLPGEIVAEGSITAYAEALASEAERYFRVVRIE